jgi:flagellar biosynthesis/type III secretory pathway chaperone
MTAIVDAAARARALLDLDHQFIDRLRELLLAERAAIEDRDARRLAETVQHTQDCVRQLERNEQERKLLLGRSGAGDWPALLRSLDPTLEGAWQALQARLREVAEITEVNARIVNRARRSTSRLLSLLRGQGTEPAGVYDRSGRTRAHGDNRAITSA